MSEERFEKMKQRANERAQARGQVESRPIGLPRFMWEELEAKAQELSVTSGELIRIWLADRLGK